MHYSSIRQLVRFCMVGVTNTGIDVSLFTALRLMHIPLMPANICSTSTALLCSLVLNYHFTFRARSLSRMRIAGYAVVTLFGLWAMQPICIKLFSAVLAHGSLGWIPGARITHGAIIRTALPKIPAIAVTMAWNYAWYSRVIFARPRQPSSTAFEPADE